VSQTQTATRGQAAPPAAPPTEAAPGQVPLRTAKATEQLRRRKLTSAAVAAMPALPPETMRLFLLLSDKNGNEDFYVVLPLLATFLSETVSWLLRNLSTGEEYTIQFTAGAGFVCTCPGFKSAKDPRGCKHCRAFFSARRVLVSGSEEEAEPVEPKSMGVSDEEWESWQNEVMTCRAVRGGF